MSFWNSSEEMLNFVVYRVACAVFTTYPMGYLRYLDGVSFLCDGYKAFIPNTT